MEAIEKKRESVGIYFEYEIIEEPQKSYGMVMNNIIRDETSTVIKSTYDWGYKTASYIVTQDDTLWQITSSKIHTEY